MSVALVRFLGSNCDRDCMHVLTHVIESQAVWAWHDDVELPPGTTAVLLPGGFSHGDYLRCGAMAAHRPIMSAVKRFAEAGGPVLGICNGFQILCESGILPGVLLPNRGGDFICKRVGLSMEGGGTGLLRGYAPNEMIELTIAHHDGNYFADDATLRALEQKQQIALRYTELDDRGDAKANGARLGIAGIFGGPGNNVLGLMPHPERQSEARLGGIDGLRLLQELTR